MKICARAAVATHRRRRRRRRGASERSKRAAAEARGSVREPVGVGPAGAAGAVDARSRSSGADVEAARRDEERHDARGVEIDGGAGARCSAARAAAGSTAATSASAASVAVGRRRRGGAEHELVAAGLGARLVGRGVDGVDAELDAGARQVGEDALGDVAIVEARGVDEQRQLRAIAAPQRRSTSPLARAGSRRPLTTAAPARARSGGAGDRG